MAGVWFSLRFQASAGAAPRRMRGASVHGFRDCRGSYAPKAASIHDTALRATSMFHERLLDEGADRVQHTLST